MISKWIDASWNQKFLCNEYDWSINAIEYKYVIS